MMAPICWTCADADSGGASPAGPDTTYHGEIERLFLELDVDKSGFLSASEVSALAAKLGAELTTEELAMAMHEMDPSGDGKVDVGEFTYWWSTQAGGGGSGVMGGAVAASAGKMFGDLKDFSASLFPAAPPAAEEVERLFGELDADKSGFLSASEVAALAAKLGAELSAEELATAMGEMDPSGDGKADLHEFSGWWRRQAAGGGGVMGGAVAANASKMVGDLKEYGAGLWAAPPPPDAAEVERLFNELDADSSGFLSADEVGQLAVKLGLELSDPDLSSAMQEMDPSGDGKVDVVEFTFWWAEQAKSPGSGAGVMSAAISDSVAANAGIMLGRLKGLMP